MDNRRPYYDFFIQDEWRVSDHLTLTPGLRYELHPEWVTRYNNGANLDFTEPLNPQLMLYRDGSRFSRAQVHTDANDFGPRIGLTYRLKESTVVRAGYGIYFGNQIGMVISAANPPFFYGATLTPDPVVPSLLLRNGLPADLISPQNATNIGFSATDPDRRSPYNQQWNFTIQHQLPSELLVELGYVGASAHKIRRTYNINTPPPGPGAVNPRRPIKSMVVPPDNVVVGPVAGIEYETGNANQNYNGLQLRIEKRLTHGLSLSTSYIYSKTIGDGQGNASIGTTSGGPQNIHDFRSERSLADEHFKNRLVTSYVYDLPFGRDRAFLNNAHSVLNAFVGGWTTAGIFSYSSGLRVDLTVQGNPSNTGGRDRPNVVDDWSLSSSERSLARWFNTGAFERNVQYTFGNAARNLLEGPSLTNFDFALYKVFPITERLRLQFRFEAFNATNTPAFGSPNAQVGNAAFGRIGSADRPRNLQLGLKLVF